MERHRWSLESPIEPRPVLPSRRGDLGVAVTPASSRFRRSTYGRYLAVAVPDTVDQRILDQGARLCGDQAITGWAALRLWGAGLFDGMADDGRTPVPVPLAVGPGGGLRQHLGARVLRDRLPQRDRVEIAGVALTAIPRATFDAMRLTRDPRRAVAVLDTVVGAGLLTLEEFTAWVGNRGGWNGIRVARWALPHAREWVRSPEETRLRLQVELDLGIGGLLVNHGIVADESDGPGEVDLFDPEAGMILEFDGADHRTRDQHRRDLAKEDAARALGLVLARFTSADLRDPGLVRRRVLSTRARAEFCPPADRPWQVTVPPPRTNQVLQLRLRQRTR